MSDAITKFLAKVTSEERKLLSKIIEELLTDKMSARYGKKLVGSKDIFRIRKGKFRIIFKKTKTDCIILSVDQRSEKTYRDF